MNTSGINGNDSWSRLRSAAESARMRNPSLNRAGGTDKIDKHHRIQGSASGLKKAERSYAKVRPRSSGASLGTKFDAYA